MLQMYRESLEALGCFNGEYPKLIKAVSGVVPEYIPDKMKMLLTATELMVYAGHLRKNISWHGASIPVNTISFLVGGSGAGKGLTLKSVSAVLSDGYKSIDKYRDEHAKQLAIEDAEADGKKATDWRKYLSKPRSLKSAVSTLPGAMKHLAKLERGKLGGGYLYVDEIGSELASNGDLAENITALAIGYDSGEIPPKMLKDDTNQVEPIYNLPYSALMFGSPKNIVFDEAIKKKFRDMFSAMLSRRSNFAFITETPERLTFDTIEESREYTRAEKTRIKTAVDGLKPWFTQLVETTMHKDLTVTSEVEDIFSDYQDYNTWYSDTFSKQFPITILHRQHLQWKSLKLAGALAILEGDEEITAEHFIEAIRFSEIFSDDIRLFEIELSKEPYELFSDHIRSIADSGYAVMSIHKLRKMGFVKGNGTPENKMTELVNLAKSYDSTNRYEYEGGYIHFYEGIPEDEDERDEME